MDFNLLFVVILVGFAAAVGFTVLKNLSRMSNLLQTSSYWRELGEKFNLTYEAQPSEHIERLIGSHRACPLALTGKGDPLSEVYEVVAEIELHSAVTLIMTLAAEPEGG